MLHRPLVARQRKVHRRFDEADIPYSNPATELLDQPYVCGHQPAQAEGALGRAHLSASFAIASRYSARNASMKSMASGSGAAEASIRTSPGLARMITESPSVKP